MKPLDKSLLVKLMLVLLVKLVLLAGLWWVFVRDQRVVVDGSRVADRILSSVPKPAEGASNDFR